MNDDLNGAKIRLSPEEMRLVSDPAWILTKNSVMARVVALMAGLSEEYRARWEKLSLRGTSDISLRGIKDIPEKALQKAFDGPKISKGENYQGLPYVILDYPRLFGHHDILAIRTMFWWGHYFSLILHLKGTYKERFLPLLRENADPLAKEGFLLAVSEDEWKHELSEDHYQPLTEKALPEGTSFLKLSAKVNLDNEAGARLLHLYDTVISVLTAPG